MENYLGLAAVFAAFILSKRDRSVPLIITIYYLLCIYFDYAFWGVHESVFSTVKSTATEIAEYHLAIVSSSVMIIVLLLSSKKPKVIVRFYAAMVTLSALHSMLSLFFSSLSMDWYTDIYLLHQRYAIQLDIIIAWLASDNALSRVVNRHWTKYVRRED
jgi:hypothetical protein